LKRRRAGRQADWLDILAERDIMAKTQQCDVVTLLPRLRLVLLMGDLLLDAYSDRIIGACLAAVAVRQAIPVSVSVILAQANAAQTPILRQVLALEAVRGREDVAVADQDTAAGCGSTIG